jgi:glucose/mannose transport system substrate-binding protein
VLTLFLACTEFDPTSVKPARDGERLYVGGTVEIFSWWTSGGEREAFEALIDEHRRGVPNAEIINAAVAFADKARDQLALRLSNGAPPDLFQANSGADLFSWVETNGHDDSATVVESLSDLSEALGWAEAFDPDVFKSVTYKGAVYGVPANVHRINSLYYRKDIFEEFNLSIPSSVSELVDLCNQVHDHEELQARAPGGRMSCLALGNKWDWAFSLFAFEILFPAIAGPDFYESYFMGKEEALPPQLREALGVAFHLYCGGKQTDCLVHTWFNPDIHERTWDEGVRKLSEEKALMAPMGDWAKGYLESAAGGALLPGKHFGVVPFPGSDGTYIFTADAFTMPQGTRNRDGARSFLRTVGSREGQIAFNRKKGSIPARTDIELEHFDEIQQQAMVSFAKSAKVPALSGILLGAARDLLQPELSASLRAESTDIIERFLRAQYPLR